MSSLPSVAIDFAFGNTPNDASPTWTTVSSFGVPSFSTKRGRAFELDSFQPGTATIQLDNRDGRYTPPGNAPYAGQMLLMVPVRIKATVSAVTYNLWRGYVERVPVTWTANGNYGWATVSAVDLIALLANITQTFGVLGYTALGDGPLGYWPLDEASGASNGRQIADTVAQLATIRTPASGYVAPTFGQSLPSLMGAGSSPAGVKINGAGATFTSGGCLVADLGQALAGNFTVECWVQTPNITLGVGQNFGLVRLYDRSSPSADPIGLYVSRIGAGGLQGSSYGGVALAASYTGTFLDGTLHHVVVTRGGSFVFLYVDGYVVASSTDATAQYTTNTVSIGGSYTAAGAQDFFTGTIAAVGVYGFDLSYAQVQAHYGAGLSAYAGDLTGARVTRLLSYATYPLTTSIATGSTNMQAASVSSQTLQASIQDAVSTERGRFFIAGNGTVTFLGRAAEYNQSPVATFGELVGSGELPYQDCALSYDPDYLFNDITVTCSSGSARVTDATSITQYGRRATTLTIEAQNDTECRALAQYLLVRFRQPLLRVASVTINPAGNAALWPVALGTEIGAVVGLNRRPARAPAITGTYVVESVEHTVDATAGTWLTKFELSPLLSGVHYWRLEDVTYGQIDNPSYLISP